jgi:hypothetical protein
MPAFPADPRRFSWSSPGGESRGRFVPNGRLVFHGRKTNPRNWHEKGNIFAARLFVGLAVDRERAWEENDVVRIVKHVRQTQVGRPDASFVLQRGLYTQAIGDEQVVIDEPSVQVIILNLPDFNAARKKFTKQMVKLAEALARELKQREVIVEIQKNGISQETIGVGP